MNKILATILLTGILAGCGKDAPPDPSEVARSNLYDSWNLGMASKASLYDSVSCGSTIEKDDLLGQVVQCSARMKGYLNNSYWRCSITPKGRCRAL